jgi:hypothetical protein
MKRLAVLAALALAACGGSSSNPGGGSGTDAAGSIDSPAAPAMITFSGTVTSKGTSSNPLAGVTIAAFGEGSTTAVAMTTSDAQGGFTLMIPTGGTALQGYVKATLSGYVDTYLYPPTAVAADTTGVTVYMVTPSTYDLLANTLCNGNQMMTNGAIAVEVMDATMATVAGATVSSQPAATKYCYNQGGFPNKSATATDTDGIAYMLNVTGQATVSASKSGLTFHSHAVNARAGALTLTIIQP